jgi:uncharacterized membrane protein
MKTLITEHIRREVSQLHIFHVLHNAVFLRVGYSRSDAWLSDEGWFFIVAKIMFINWKIGINLHGSLYQKFVNQKFVNRGIGV